MVLKFRLKNVFSFRDEITLDLQAAKIQTEKGKALSGYFLMRLFNWCDINDSSQHGLLRDYIAKNYHGPVVKIGAVNAEKRKYLKVDNCENRRQQDDFNTAIENFLSRF